MKTFGFGTINFNKGGSASVRLEPEEDEDLWQLYNMVAQGDKIRARTTRKIKLERSSGNVSVEVKHIILTIEIAKVEFQPTDKSIRFSGKNIELHDDVKLGQFHTIEIGIGDSLTLTKEDWDYASRERLKASADARMNAEVAAILIDASSAALYVLSNSLVKECCRCTANVAKNKPLGKADKAREKFFESILLSIQHQFKVCNMKCILIGGPNEVKDIFYDWLFETAVKKNLAELMSKKKIFVKGLASGIAKSALAEMMQDPAIADRMADTKGIGEVKIISKFHKMHNEDSLRACYGPGPVSVAADYGAVNDLIISDHLFRSSTLKHRIFYSNMAQSVKDGGGNVVIVASLGIAGDDIKNLGSIAAILRYPCYEIEDLEPTYLPPALLEGMN